MSESEEKLNSTNTHGTNGKPVYRPLENIEKKSDKRNHGEWNI